MGKPGGRLRPSERVGSRRNQNRPDYRDLTEVSSVKSFQPNVTTSLSVLSKIQEAIVSSKLGRASSTDSRNPRPRSAGGNTFGGRDCNLGHETLLHLLAMI